MNEFELNITIGQQRCNLTSVNMRQIICQPPVYPPAPTDELGRRNPIELPAIVLKIGNMRRHLGYIYYSDYFYAGFNDQQFGGGHPPNLDQDSLSRFYHQNHHPSFGGVGAGGGNRFDTVNNNNSFNVELLIVISILIGTILTIVSIIILAAYKNKQTEAEREYKRIQLQMDTLENNVRAECKQAFAELQTDILHSNGLLNIDDLQTIPLPTHDERTFLLRMFFVSGIPWPLPSPPSPSLPAPAAAAALSSSSSPPALSSLSSTSLTSASSSSMTITSNKVNNIYNMSLDNVGIGSHGGGGHSSSRSLKMMMMINNNSQQLLKLNYLNQMYWYYSPYFRNIDNHDKLSLLPIDPQLLMNDFHYNNNHNNNGSQPVENFYTINRSSIINNSNDNNTQQQQNYQRPSIVIEQFEQLLMNRTFLLILIDTLEKQTKKSFSITERMRFASLLMITLLDRMEYSFDIMRQLLSQLIDRFATNKHSTLELIKCNETIVEKMLIDWLSICLYKYAREVSSGPLFLLFSAIKHQIDKGPVDFVTGNSRYLFFV